VRVFVRPFIKPVFTTPTVHLSGPSPHPENPTMPTHPQTSRAPAFRIALLSAAVMLAACGQQSAQHGVDEAAIRDTPAQPSAPTEDATSLPAPPPVAELRASSNVQHKVATPSPAFAAQESVARIVAADAFVNPGYTQPLNTERYAGIRENPLQRVADSPVSTFSLDVDTGSYSNVRRFLANGTLPPKDAVRIEELVNYFPYDYPLPRGEHPFGVSTEIAPAPWNTAHWLLRAAVRADEVSAARMPPANLVFLVDVSGSMDTPQKLPLLRSALNLLVDQLREQDRVSLVVYAGRESVALEPTSGSEKSRIRNAIDQLSAGGATAGEAGIRLAYRMARQGFIDNGINRVLLATDGDFNVGIADTEQLKDLVERERESGVQLSTLGFGTDNYNEAMMEQMADVGNGNYAYIDTLQEARKVLVDQMRSTLVTVAKDVKVQIEFNPAVVSEYRLIGYENRMLAREDFNNDRVDAGDVGAGQTVTALYELTPVSARQSVDALRYGAPDAAPARGKADADEIAFLRVRYKPPQASASRLLEQPIARSSVLPAWTQASDDWRFATAVAGFGQLLRGGTHTADWGYAQVIDTAAKARGTDEYGYRGEFLSLARLADSIGR